ncbi:hypothetical protein VFPFJ_06702 [Purpureocillium lilacinum]|uniref:Uncharacterized protein n=1 Tax=Purpureocillium lilacinum TaxID=33203 RepID=A0A179HDE8_PURLI|nr:hypothetical protein VFPFJ_06702 [Purpureocillium lilacinum]OAQ88237.1 hypothetical protein VFPFJ_06702 [Purpureocillium lilacinum]
MPDMECRGRVGIVSRSPSRRRCQEGVACGIGHGTHCLSVANKMLASFRLAGYRSCRSDEKLVLLQPFQCAYCSLSASPVMQLSRLPASLTRMAGPTPCETVASTYPLYTGSYAARVGSMVLGTCLSKPLERSTCQVGVKETTEYGHTVTSRCWERLDVQRTCPRGTATQGRQLESLAALHVSPFVTLWVDTCGRTRRHASGGRDRIARLVCRSTGKVGEGSLGREYKGHIDSPNCGQAVCWKVPNRKRLFPPPEREAASLQPGNTPA